MINLPCFAIWEGSSSQNSIQFLGLTYHRRYGFMIVKIGFRQVSYGFLNAYSDKDQEEFMIIFNCLI